ncbi:MAG: glycosyltransferase family 4 protein, partial [Phycisphaerales bacterium]|nr:glycosyltransferase family 4 protein [Phycisphaerales bacterium]
GQRLRLNRTLWMQGVLPAHLARLKPDIAHFTNSTAPLIAPCPVVITIHDMTLWLMPGYHPISRLAAMRPIIPLVAQRAAAVIAVSESAREDVINILKLPPERVHVIYEAPAREFRPIPPSPALDAVGKRYHLPPRFLLYVGTIEPRKNIARLLEAFAMLRRAGEIDHDLILVGGKGWKDHEIYEAIERLRLFDQVRFLGHIPILDLVAIYNLAAALVFPSLYEGFGLPVIEAMACGTPVITSPNGSLREVAGDAAQFVDPLDIESIAHGIRRVVCDPIVAAHFSEHGLARAACFSWQRVAAQTYRVYEQVAK